MIACEDTRQTQKLLEHLQIRKPLVSYHEHNESSRTSVLLEHLERGDSVGLVSDAGTPLISDPGYRVVVSAIQNGITVVPIPGPSAILAALAASGLPTDQFRFLGFLPAKAGARRRLLEELVGERATVLVYESPHRVLETLLEMAQLFGERRVVVGRELTKLHEEFLRGSAQEIYDRLSVRASIKGEITIAIGRSDEKESVEDPLQEVERLQTEEGLERMEAIKAVAKRLGLPKREVYRLSAAQGNNPPGKRRD